MHPFVLLGIAIVCEVAATVSLRLSEGFSRPVPALIVVVGYGISFVLLAEIVQRLPLAVTYAVWSSVGIAAVACIGAVAFDEAFTVTKLAFLLLIIAGVAGLTTVGAGH